MTTATFPATERAARAATLLTERVDGDGALPMGTLAVVAAEVGFSRERVRQIDGRLGYRMQRPATLPPGVCETCDGPTKPGKRFCSPQCAAGNGKRYFDRTETCANCGTVFVFTAAAQKQRRHNIRTHGLKHFDADTPVCGQRCATTYAAKLREPRHGTFTQRVLRKCGCPECLAYDERRRARVRERSRRRRQRTAA